MENTFDLDQIKQDIKEMDFEMQDEDFWNNPKEAAATQKKRLLLDRKLRTFEDLELSLKDFSELLEMVEEGSEEFKEIDENIQKLEKKIKKFETELLLSGKYDTFDAFLTIHAGTGGVDAMDWAEILLRQYTRFFENQGWKYEIIHIAYGDEAGLKHATILVEGIYVYGKLKNEHGVHRLVRNSPFNSKGLRQTSFALIEVMPKVEIHEDIRIEDKDIRIDTYRASGAGGQHINKTDSAVRITHIPSSIVVQCQNQRSQAQNKETAMHMLYSKLLHLKAEQNKEKIDELKGDNYMASWGNQIRSYIFSPYTLVKDHRTNHESTDVQRVLDGDLEDFIESMLLNNK